MISKYPLPRVAVSVKQGGEEEEEEDDIKS